jgi:hypothetical protein
MSKPGNPPASNNSALVTADPTNLGTTAAAPIGREIDRRVDPIVAAVLACPQVAGLHGGRRAGPVEPDRLRSGPEPLMAPLMAPPPPGVCTHDHGNAALRGGT